MAKARALDKRRKSIRNIRKITRTMELISTATFRRAMERALAAAAYTKRIGRLVADLAASGVEVSHPLLQQRETPGNALLLVLSASRGMCGGYNSSVLRVAVARWEELRNAIENLRLEVSGKRGVSELRFRKLRVDQVFTHFTDRPLFGEVEVLANRYLDAFETGQLDRLDVVYTKFVSLGRQYPVAETLLPIGDIVDENLPKEEHAGDTPFDFLPSAESILEEALPMSFKLKLFQCFLDATVSEQVARMLAMKAATENADKIISNLTMTYNRARQSQITNEILEVIGGAEAQKK